MSIVENIKIERVSFSYYEWPRAQAISNGLHTYATVRLGITRIDTNVGVTGYGTAMPAPGENAIRERFGELIIGRDPTMTEAIWASLRSAKLFGRRGVETRALSSIDMALWDIKAKLAGMPLSRLLGGFRSKIDTYVAGGYYTEGKGLQGLQDEMAGHVERGARAVKMKIGAVEIAEDVERVRAVREALGPDIKIMLDANCAYAPYEAIQLARRVEEFDIFWFEEPVNPEDYDGFRRIAHASAIPLAAGENEYTKFGFRDLIATQAVAFLQPDVQYMGGVTEFMKVAAMAQAHGLHICPHGEQQAHIQLLGAIPNARMLEFVPRELNPMFGQVFKHTPTLNSDGTVTIPETPGLGCDPDEKSLEKYRV